MKLTSADRILILAPHPDDELLSSYKLMRDACAAGAAVKVVFLTDGERNHLAHMRAKKKLFITSAGMRKYALERRAEAAAVLKRLGPVESEFWEVPDSGVTAALAKAGLANRLSLLLKAFSPTLLVAPSLGETHPDHNAAAALAEIALAPLPENLRPGLLRYSLHPGRRFHHEEFPVRIGLGAAERKEKKILAGLYRSQFPGISRLLNGSIYAEYFSNTADAGGPRLTPVHTGKNSAWFRTDLRGSLARLEFTALYYGAGGCVRAVFRLNWRKGGAELRDPDSGKTAGTARFQKFFRGPGGYIVLPHEIPGGSKLFCVKVAHKPGYFDTAGFVKALPETASKAPVTCVVIPCYNIAEFCGQAVAGAAVYADHVIAVDDGSTDSTAASLAEASKFDNVRVITFPENRGKGAALLAGMRAALKETDCGLLLTMDGDMQHRPADIPAFQAACRDGGEFIIGYRGFSGKVPFRSRLGNNIINSFVRQFLNRALIDSQSGFRGFSRACAAAMVKSENVREGRYETEIDIISAAIKGNWRLAQVEIPTIYIGGNKKSSFKPVADSFLITKTFLINMSGLRRSPRGSAD